MTSIAGDDGDWTRKARNQIYARARTGEVFSAYDLLQDLGVPRSGPLADKVFGLMKSAAQAEILVRVGMAQLRAPVDPEEWVKTGATGKLREVQQWRGAPELLGRR